MVFDIPHSFKFTSSSLSYVWNKVVFFIAYHFVLDLKRLPVYHQELTTEKYLYQDNIAEMSQFTLCFWIKMSSLDLPSRNYIVGIAYSG